MNLQDEKRRVLTNLMKRHCSVEEALTAIEFLEKQQFEELIVSAGYVVEDFDNFGPVLQTDEEGEYGPNTSIECLRAGLTIANSSEVVNDPCERCKKCGENICGNDTEFHRCFEPFDD